MARSIRSKRRLRNQRAQVEKLKVFENNRLEEIIKKRDNHLENQIVNADALNIPPELAALNKNTDEMQVEKPKEKEIKKKNENVMDEEDEDSDEEMNDSTKVKKSNTAHLSNKENKQRFIKQYIKKQKKRAQQKKKVPII